MLFACGIGTGLFFYGVAEPLFHYVGPNRYTADPTTPENTLAQIAINLTLFHWGMLWMVQNPGQSKRVLIGVSWLDRNPRLDCLLIGGSIIGLVGVSGEPTHDHEVVLLPVVGWSNFRLDGWPHRRDLNHHHPVWRVHEFGPGHKTTQCRTNHVERGHPGRWFDHSGSLFFLFQTPL